MRPIHRKLKASPSRRGSAILMVLVAVVILFIFFAIASEKRVIRIIDGLLGDQGISGRGG